MRRKNVWLISFANSTRRIKQNWVFCWTTKDQRSERGKRKQKLSMRFTNEVKITINPDDVWERDIFCDYPYLLKDLAIGDIIKIDSWLFDVQVTVIEWDHCKGKALNSALIWSYRHINLPGKKLKLPALTDQDKEDLLFGIQHKITIIAMSFVRSADHIKELDPTGRKTDEKQYISSQR